MKLKQLESILVRLGYVLIRSNSHKIWRNGTVTIIVPHARVIGTYIVKDILKKISYNENVQCVNYKVAA